MNAVFHLPAFFTHCGFMTVLLEMKKHFPQFFRENIEIGTIDDAFQPSAWNGRYLTENICSLKTAEEIVRSFNERGVPIRFTFTNPVISQKHLGDDFCNSIMKLAGNGMNEVMVTSPVLEEYIREFYPEYKITSAACESSRSFEEAAALLEKDYSLVALNSDLNAFPDKLAQLPNREKIELYVNCFCTPDCPSKADHLRSVGEQQTAFANHARKYPNVPFELKKYGITSVYDCPCMSRNIFNIKNLSTFISPDDITEKFLPMGISHFRIEGRSFDVLNLTETLFYYLIKPEHAAHARYEFFFHLNNAGVITVSE